MRPLLGLAVNLLLPAMLLAGWEAAVRAGQIDAELLPPPSAIAASAHALLQDDRFRADLRVTGAEIAVAYALVVPLAVTSGFVLAESRRLAAAVSPVLNLIISIPQSIFLPIFILALGIGFTQKVVFGMSLGFFVITVNSLAAARSVPAGFVTAARAFGASRRQVYARVYVPAMLPVLLGGLRLGLIFTMTGVLLAEMYAAQSGVGRAIFVWGESYQVREMMAAVAMVIVVAVTANAAIARLERLVDPAARPLPVAAAVPA